MIVEPGVLFIITAITALIMAIFIKYAKTKNEKLVYLFIAIGLYLYSGYGIAYTSVDNKYVSQYVLFLFCILSTFKLTVGTGRKRQYILFSENDIELTIEKSPRTVKILAVTFIATLFVYLITPRFRLQELIFPPLSNAVGIHARAANKNIINRIADTVNIAVRPFFLIYLQSLADEKKQVKYFAFSALWIYLEYLQLGYLSRYQMMIYLMFIIFSLEINKYGEIVLSRKTKYILTITIVVSIPLMVAFLSLRTGRGVEISGFASSLETLIDGETYYPIYYERISTNSWGISPITFIMWIICLPIPSFLWSSKPYVDPSYALTTNLYGFVSKSDSNYYNSLPSMFGESMMIFGNNFYFLEAIIIGFFVGIYFRFLFRSKKLNTLTLYMTLMLLTLGRGGATSYMSGLINGTIIMVVWIIFVKYRSRTYITSGYKQ